MGRVLITSKGGTATPAPTGTVAPVVVTSPQLTGGGTVGSVLDIATGMVRPDVLINPGFPALLGSSGGPYQNLQLGGGLTIDPATSTVSVQFQPGQSPINVDTAIFDGDGSAAGGDLSLLDGGVPVQKLEPIATSTLLGNPAATPASPGEITVDTPLLLSAGHLQITVGDGIEVSPAGELQVDQRFLDPLYLRVAQVSPPLVGDGSRTSPLELPDGALGPEKLAAAPADALLGTQGGSVQHLVLGTGLQAGAGTIQIDMTSVAPAIHQHDAADINSGTLNPDRIADNSIPWIKMARDSGTVTASDGYVITWDQSVGRYVPKNPAGLVSGSFVVPRGASFPPAAPGTFFYHTTTNTLRYHDGTGWKTVTLT